jgi:CheY-like chemotaxis protein
VPEKTKLKRKGTTKRDRGSTVEGEAMRILIVDDAPINCRLLQRTFLDASKRLHIPQPKIVIAGNGQEAVDLVSASLPLPDTFDLEEGARSPPFNLVCIDRQMPIMGGVGTYNTHTHTHMRTHTYSQPNPHSHIEATRRIKNLEEEYFNTIPTRPSLTYFPTANKPAYVVGMSASIENPADWLAVGLDEMLPKPFSASDIETLLLAMHVAVTAVEEAPSSVPGYLDAVSPGLTASRDLQGYVINQPDHALH